MGLDPWSHPPSLVYWARRCHFVQNHRQYFGILTFKCKKRKKEKKRLEAWAGLCLFHFHSKKLSINLEAGVKYREPRLTGLAYLLTLGNKLEL